MKFYFVNCLSVGSCIFCVKKTAFLSEENAFTRTKEIAFRLFRIGIIYVALCVYPGNIFLVESRIWENMLLVES